MTDYVSDSDIDRIKLFMTFYDIEWCARAEILLALRLHPKVDALHILLSSQDVKLIRNVADLIIYQ